MNIKIKPKEVRKKCRLCQKAIHDSKHNKSGYCCTCQYFITSKGIKPERLDRVLNRYEESRGIK